MESSLRLREFEVTRSNSDDASFSMSTSSVSAPLITSTPFPSRQFRNPFDSTSLSDLCDKFQNNVYVDDSLERKVELWKQREMAGTMGQLEPICSLLLSDTLGAESDGLRMSDTLLTSLGLTLALLEPGQIKPAAIASALSLRSHRLLEKETLLVSLKAQTEELKAERRKVAATIADTRSDLEQTQCKIKHYEEEMGAVDQDEVKRLLETYRGDITAELDHFRRLDTIESICSKDKIDAAITNVKKLQKEAESLAHELIFAKTLPPNIRQVKVLVNQRKQHLQEVIQKVQDLVEYGYKS